MKSIYRNNTKQNVGMESDISRSKNSTISQVVCAGTPSSWKV